MRRSEEAARKGETHAAPAPGQGATAGVGDVLVDEILKWLDDAKAERILAIDIRGKTSMGDWMVIANGRTDRHVGAIADQLMTKLKDYGVSNVRVEGQQTCDWVLVDVGAIIVHLFRPEVREFYNLEKMWTAERPPEQAH